jgi:hypothetical protein
LTMPVLLLLGPLFVGVIAAAFALAGAVVEAGVSRLRVALWRLHDDLVDDLVAQRLADERSAVRLLDLVRRSIVEAKQLTALRVFGTYLLYRVSAGNREIARNRILRGETRDPLVNAYAHQLVHILSSGVYETTILGRFGRVGFPLAFVGVQILRGRGVSGARSSQQITEAPVRTEVQLDYALHPGLSTEREMAGVAC